MRRKKRKSQSYDDDMLLRPCNAAAAAAPAAAADVYVYDVCMQTPFWFLILCIPIPIETNSEMRKL